MVWSYDVSVAPFNVRKTIQTRVSCIIPHREGGE